VNSETPIKKIAGSFAGSRSTGHSTIVRRESGISDELKNSGLHPLLKKIYANRGVTKLKQIDYSLKDLLDYSLLKDIELY